MNKLHELIGQIINKELRKVYNKASPYHGNNCYKLTIINDHQQKDLVFVYPNLVRAEIFRTIERSRYIDKRYHFFCERKAKR